MAIAAARSEADIYKWAFNWAGMYNCKIVPVLTDAQVDLSLEVKLILKKLQHVVAQMM